MCIQSECRPDEIVIGKYKEMFESRISAGQLKITRMGKTSRKNCSVVLRQRRTCSKMRGKVSGIGEKKKTEQQLHKVSSNCLDDHQIKKEELESVGELSEVCSQFVLKCL